MSDIVRSRAKRRCDTSLTGPDRILSVQYDKVIESETYVNELLGSPKEKESLWSLLTNTRILQLKMGRIDGQWPAPGVRRISLPNE